MSLRVFYDILNQKGTPAFYTDTLANRPAFGYAGRVFISTDSGQIFEDTGSAWTLIADAGVGGGTLSSVCLNGNTTATGIVITAGGLSTNSVTNTGNTAGSVLFAGTGGLESQSNATFFWDNTNKRLGIGNATPGAPLDVHGTGTQIQVNGTGTNNSYIQFQNAGTSKWRIGNNYNAGANSFDIFNNGLSNTPFSINSSTNAITTNNYILINNNLGTNQIYLPKSSGDVYGTIQTEASGGKFSLGNVSNLGTLGTPNITWTSGMQVGINNSNPTYDFDVNGTGRFTGILRLGSTLSNGTYFYTLPSANGTLALTSALSSYLPLTGGTLTGQLYINPTNTATIGLDVASDNISFRSDNLEGFKRQLLITMGSGTLIQFTAQGYGANYGTDLAFYTATTSGVNSSPAIYITGTNNRVGIKTGTPSYDLDVTGGLRSTTSSYLATSSGSVGIGTTSASYPLDVQAGASLSQRIRNNAVGGTATLLLETANTFSGTSQAYVQCIGSTGGGQSQLAFATAGASGDTTATERLRITSGGLVLVNTISNFESTASQFQVAFDNNNYFGMAMKSTAAGSFAAIRFLNNSGTLQGSITSTGTGVTAYNVTSDYRLKQDLKDFNGLNFINSIKIYDYQLKSDNSRMHGVMAHELQEVIPYAVVGEKDGEEMQGVDYSKLVPVLIKAIQELNEKLVRNNIN